MAGNTAMLEAVRRRVQKKTPLGEGGRFKALKNVLASKGARDPGALAAYIGRKKYGAKKFNALASRGK